MGILCLMSMLYSIPGYRLLQCIVDFWSYINSDSVAVKKEKSHVSKIISFFFFFSFLTFLFCRRERFGSLVGECSKAACVLSKSFKRKWIFGPRYLLSKGVLHANTLYACVSHYFIPWYCCANWQMKENRIAEREKKRHTYGSSDKKRRISS